LPLFKAGLLFRKPEILYQAKLNSDRECRDWSDVLYSGVRPIGSLFYDAQFNAMAVHIPVNKVTEIHLDRAAVPNEKRILGFEFEFGTQETPGSGSYLSFGLEFRDGAKNHCGMIMYYLPAGRLDIRKSDGTYETLGTYLYGKGIIDQSKEWALIPFNKFKLVVDLLEDKYVGILFNNDKIVDTRAIYVYADTSQPRTHRVFLLIGSGTAIPLTFWMRNVTITYGEERRLNYWEEL